MARNGKIDSSGPNKAMNFLKKNIQTLPIDGRIGRSIERDIVDFDIAKKACEKANIEGQAKGIALALNTVVAILSGDDDKAKIAIQELNKLNDSILAQSV